MQLDNGDEKLENKTNTREKEFIEHFETTTPKELLEAMLSGEEAAKYDTGILQYLMTNRKLPKPVMNILVYYVTLHCRKELALEDWEKIVSYWSEKKLKTVQEAIEFVKSGNKVLPDLSKKKILNQRAKIQSPMQAKETENPFTLFEYRYMENLFKRYKMNFDISQEIILYGRKVNNGLLIYWFLDAVSDYIYRHNGKTTEDVKSLLDLFHGKFVKNFGKEE